MVCSIKKACNHLQAFAMNYSLYLIINMEVSAVKVYMGT